MRTNIKNKKILFFCFTVCYALLTGKADSQQLYFPPLTGTVWETISPSSLNWNSDKIDTLMEFLEANRTKAFIVLKDGQIVLEQYFGSFTRDGNWYWASAGKSLTAFVIGIMQQNGDLSINDSTSRYLGGGWTSCPPEKESLIKIIHQLTMTTGLDETAADPECTLPDSLIYEADAGTRWAYHTAPYTLLDAVIENASGDNYYNRYFNTLIKSRTGMSGMWTPVNYDNVYFSDARSMARFGLLILNRGIWDSDTLLADTSYFHDMTNSSQIYNPSYGYLWWLNGKSSYMVPSSQIRFQGSWAPDAPSDMIAALGRNGQFINVVPSQHLVMVRMGEAPDTSYDVPMQFNNDIWKKLNDVIYSQSAAGKIQMRDMYLLEQNYPNPFNPSTTIYYSLRTYCHASIKIYDILGREIASLINENKSAGSYKIVWNAAGLSNGIYFCRLNIIQSTGTGTGLFTSTKKIVLLK